MHFEIDLHAHISHLLIHLSYPPHPNIAFNFSLTVIIFHQAMPSMECHLIWSCSFDLPQKNIKIEGLQGNKMYKVECSCKLNSGLIQKKTAFIFLDNKKDSEQSPNSRQLDEELSVSQARSNIRSYFEINENSNGESHTNKPKRIEQTGWKQAPLSESESLMKMIAKSCGIKSGKKAEQVVLRGRNCRNTKQFLNEKDEKLKKNVKDLLQKRELILKGKMMFADIYEPREGMQFFKNSWFMGPFYSYDQNEAVIKDQPSINQRLP